MAQVAERLGRILVFDDLQSNLRVISRWLRADQFEVRTSEDPDTAVEIVLRHHPDAVLMDVRMPSHDGFSICRALKQNPITRLIPVVLMTAANDPADRLEAIEAGADDFVTKPLHREELAARLRSLVRVKRYTDDLDRAEDVIISLALTIEARDAYTVGHCQRLASAAVALGHALGLPAEDLVALRRGAFMHDLGKVGVPDSILLKPSTLTPSEYELMKQHAVIGDRLCGDLRALRRVRGIVRHHHERLDGSGYPDGLRGDEIPELAQIIGLVDVYDALTTDRPYRPAIAPAEACAQLRHEAEAGWRRRDLVDTFIGLVESGVIAQAMLPGTHAAVTRW
jgi:putative two-component system response regulator